LLHFDKDGKDRTVRTPRLEAKCPRRSSIFVFIKVDDQIVWPIAGTLLVAESACGHLVVIAECPDEVFPRSICRLPIDGRLQASARPML